jgi:hypothetical protein
MVSCRDEEWDCSFCGVTRPHTHSNLVWDDDWGLVPGSDDTIMYDDV